MLCSPRAIDACVVSRRWLPAADFEAALGADLNGTTTALRLTAEGQYDAAGNTFTARRITILLSN